MLFIKAFAQSGLTSMKLLGILVILLWSRCSSVKEVRKQMNFGTSFRLLCPRFRARSESVPVLSVMAIFCQAIERNTKGVSQHFEKIEYDKCGAGISYVRKESKRRNKTTHFHPVSKGDGITEWCFDATPSIWGRGRETQAFRKSKITAYHFRNLVVGKVQYFKIG